MSSDATKKSPRMTIRERMTALHRARVSFCMRAKTWNKTAWRKHPIAKPTRAAIPLISVTPFSVWREKKNPIIKLMIPKNTCPMNEHQKAVLKENWTRPINLLSESSRIIPTATQTAESRRNTEQLLAQPVQSVQPNAIHAIRCACHTCHIPSLLSPVSARGGNLCCCVQCVQNRGRANGMNCKKTNGKLALSKHVQNSFLTVTSPTGCPSHAAGSASTASTRALQVSAIQSAIKPAM